MNRLIVVIAAVVALPAFAEGPEMKDPFEAMYSPKRLLRGAQLTPQQVEQILQLRRPGRPAERAIEAEMDATWAEIEEKLLADGTPDAAAVTQLSQKYDRLSGQLDQLKMVNLLKMRELMTKEQVAAVRQARKETKKLDQRSKEIDAERREIPATVAGENGP